MGFELPASSPARLLTPLVLLLLLLLVAPAHAAPNSAYAWTEADLALLYPAGWAQPVPSAADTALLLALSGGDMQITLAVLLNPTSDAALRAALDTQLAAAGLLPLRYNLAPLYGRGGLSAEAVSADRQLVGAAHSGHMPDDRALLIVGRAPKSEAAALDDSLALVLNSLVFSAGVPPVAPAYAPVWTAQAAGAAVGLALGGDRLYTVSADAGVQVYDAKTGTLLNAIPFDHPAQPTGLAVDAQGTAYVGDLICRCVRIASAAGRWLDPVGSFGGGAPLGLALAGEGTIYAVDKKDSGYFLRVLGASSRTVGLNFNGSAPPLLAVDKYGQVWVIEWLESLIDGSISGAVSLVGGVKPEAALQFWLEKLPPESVTAMTTDPDGNLAIATTDHGILLINSAGQVSAHIPQEAQALAFGMDGTLYLTRADGSLSALNTKAAPDRFGALALVPGVPVGGTLVESAPQQEWTYQGAAGERVTFSAVDQSRTGASALGLDMALRLIAPDGSEVAYNDDQEGADLFGVYDAQLSDVTLPQAGVYTVRVEWRQGQGSYTLGVGGDQAAPPGTNGVIRIEGTLQDVFPVQRWTFAGRRGDVLTLTMTAENPALDAALALYRPDGSLLAYNDDAADPVLDTNAQISQVRLPADGTYTAAATRANGSGRYNLTIVNTG